MTPRSRCVAFVLALGLVAPAAAQDVVDGVVAVVGEQPLTLSAVQFETEVRSVLDHGGTWIHEQPPQATMEVLELLIERSLLLQESGTQPVSVDDQVLGRLETFLDRFERLEDLTSWLERWKIGTVELRAHFVDEFRAVEFAEIRLGPVVRVSDSELLEAYQADVLRWGDVGFEQATPEIRAELRHRRFEDQYQRWIGDIRARRGVRITALGRMVLGATP